MMEYFQDVFNTRIALKLIIIKIGINLLVESLFISLRAKIH